MPDKRVKVLYIGSLNRSGSTLLTKYLNEFEGFFSVNEIAFIGLHGIHNDFALGNGEKFSKNAIWQSIIKKAFGASIDWQELSFFERNIHKDLGLPIGYVIPQSQDTARLNRYRENIAKLYQAIADVTQCSVIVDSSKSPDYAYLLATVENIDVYLLHLIRDFRGVFYSHQKRVKRQDLGSNNDTFAYMQGARTERFVWYTYIASLKFYLLKRKMKYLRMKYEDFCSNPVVTAREIITFLEENQNLPKIAEDGEISLKKDNLGIWGNPMRMKNKIQIHTDHQWKNKLPLGKRKLIRFLLYPLFKLYNY
jgi:hypothetical protein